MKTLTLKDFATYRGAVTARAKALLAEAQGVRWYRCAGWGAGVLGFVAGLGNWVGLIPAKYAEYAGPVAGVCSVCAMLAPRATRAAGILKVAYGQKRPLLPVLLEVAQVFGNPTAIIAEAKATAQKAEADQARQQSEQTQQEQAALIEAAVVKVVSTLSGVYLPGQLSDAVPDALKQQPAPAPTPPVALVEAMPIATGPEAGDQQPGDQQPGDQQPGDQQPGDQQPGDQQPGDQQPGDQQPGDQQPGDQQPGDQP